MIKPLLATASTEDKRAHYEQILGRIDALIAEESDWIAAMATIACELHHAFDYFHWTGFYRLVEPQLLKVGPYQGGHGCLQIAFDRGVCGAAARTQKVQLIANVNEISDHIACSSTTQSEIVVPIIDATGATQAVIDIDSDILAAFDETDQHYLTALCQRLERQYFC